MIKKHGILQKVADAMDLPGEPMPGVTYLELLGDGRILVDCHHGIKEYSAERICISASYGWITVYGTGLHLSRMSARSLIITGKASSLEILRRDPQ